MNWQNLLDISCTRIEQFLVFLHRTTTTIVEIIRQVEEAIMVVVEGGIMADGIITIVEEDRIMAMAKTIREGEISTTAEVAVVEVVGEVIPKLLMEEVIIKEEEEAPIAIRMVEETATRTITIKVEVDRVIIREGVMARTNNYIEDETQTNIQKIQE